MSGQTERMHLLTEEELNILAAASGIHGLLSFQPTQPSSQAERTAAVYQLLRRGALVPKGTKMDLSDELAPIFRCIREAGSALLLTPHDLSSPQLCLYCAAQEAAFWMPHETKRNNLRLGWLGWEHLPGLLEELGLLPTSYAAGPTALAEFRQEDVSPLTLSLGGDGRVQDRVALDESILTLLERFDILNGTVQDRAAVFRAPISWGLAVFSDPPVYRPYAREAVLTWIKEGAL